MEGEVIQFPSAVNELHAEEPTGELRWHNGVLQMLWSETIFNDGHPVRGGTFWRDVPSSEN